MLSYRLYYYYFGVIGQRTGRQLLLKKAFILTDPKRRGHAWGDTEFSQEATEWETTSGDFTMVSGERNRKGRLNRFRTGQFESFKWALGQRYCSWLSDIWPWSDLTGDSETPVKEVAVVETRFVGLHLQIVLSG